MADPEDVFEANFGGTHTEAKLNDSIFSVFLKPKLRRKRNRDY